VEFVSDDISNVSKKLNNGKMWKLLRQSFPKILCSLKLLNISFGFCTRYLAVLN